jgi:hypothetical protein
VIDKHNDAVPRHSTLALGTRKPVPAHMHITPWVRRALSVVIGVIAVVGVLSYISSPNAMAPRHLAGAFAVASLICFRFGLVGLVTGTVDAPSPGGRSPRAVPVRRDENPLLFWLSVGLYVGGGMAFLIAAVVHLA